MSRDFHLLIDAAVSAQAVRDDFVNAHGLTPNSGGWLLGPTFNAIVRPSTKNDEFIADPGIANTNFFRRDRFGYQVPYGAVSKTTES